MQAVLKLIGNLLGTGYEATLYSLEWYLALVKRSSLYLALALLMGSGLIISGVYNPNIGALTVPLGIVLSGTAIAIWTGALILVWVSIQFAHKHEPIKKVFDAIMMIILLTYSLAGFVFITNAWSNPKYFGLLMFVAGVITLLILFTGRRVSLDILIIRTKVMLIGVSLMILAGAVLPPALISRANDLPYKITDSEPHRILYDATNLNSIKFFNTNPGKNGGKPEVYYYLNEKEEYELYDNAGFHPKTGQELRPVNLTVVREIERKLKTASGVPMANVGTDTSSDKEPVAVYQSDPLATPEEPPPNKSERLAITTIKAGTILKVKTLVSISSNLTRPGKVYYGKLSDSLYGGEKEILSAGLGVAIRVTSCKPATKNKKAEISLDLIRIINHRNKIPVKTEVVKIVGSGPSIKGRVLKIIGGTVIGTSAGAVIDGKSGAKKGAAIGASGGTIAAILTKGSTIEIPVGYVFEFKLTEPISLAKKQ